MFRSLVGPVAFVAAVAAFPASAEPAFGPHVTYAIIKHVASSTLVVQRENGRSESVDISAARANGRTGVLYVGRAVALYGNFDKAHHYHVNAIVSAYGLHHGAWPPAQ